MSDVLDTETSDGGVGDDTIIGSQLGSGTSGGGLASTKGSADDDKGEPQFVKDF